MYQGTGIITSLHQGIVITEIPDITTLGNNSQYCGYIGVWVINSRYNDIGEQLSILWLYRGMGDKFPDITTLENNSQYCGYIGVWVINSFSCPIDI